MLRSFLSFLSFFFTKCAWPVTCLTGSIVTLMPANTVLHNKAHGLTKHYCVQTKTPRMSVWTCPNQLLFQLCCFTQHCIDEFQINEINVDLRTSGFDNEVLSVDACAV